MWLRPLVLVVVVQVVLGILEQLMPKGLAAAAAVPGNESYWRHQKWAVLARL